MAITFGITGATNTSYNYINLRLCEPGIRYIYQISTATGGPSAFGFLYKYGTGSNSYLGGSSSTTFKSVIVDVYDALPSVEATTNYL